MLLIIILSYYFFSSQLGPFLYSHSFPYTGYNTHIHTHSDTYIHTHTHTHTFNALWQPTYPNKRPSGKDVCKAHNNDTLAFGTQGKKKKKKKKKKIWWLSTHPNEKNLKSELHFRVQNSIIFSAETTKQANEGNSSRPLEFLLTEVCDCRGSLFFYSLDISDPFVGNHQKKKKKKKKRKQPKKNPFLNFF